MEARALAKNAPISPRKARLIADLIRGKSVMSALSELIHHPQKAARLIRVLLNSAAANALYCNKTKRESLHIKEIRVDQGRVLKRSRPRSRGSAHPILKRSSHLKVIVAD